MKIISKKLICVQYGFLNVTILMLFFLGCYDANYNNPNDPFNRSNNGYGWTRIIGGTSTDEGSSITADANGNIYITGGFSNTVNFAADWGGTESKTSAGSYDIYITKINNNSTYGWTRRIGGVDYDYGASITTDTNGNVYITGNFKGTVNFEADWGGTDNKTSAVDEDIFVTKINSNGTYGWTRSIGGTSFEYSYSIRTDINGNIYITGEFQGTTNFAADWSGTDNKTSAGTTDIFVTKINSNGTYGWTRIIGGTSNDAGTNITTDTSGNIYLTGYFQSTVNFAADWGSTDNKTSAGYNDAFVIKINSNGTYGWTHRIGGVDGDPGNSITTDTNGNVYITGNFGSTVNFAADWGSTDNKTSTGGYDIFVTKINSNGTYGWTHRIGGGSSDESSSITSDTNGNVYITGSFGSNVNFAADWGGTDNRTSAGGDIFIIKINSSGTYGWTHRIGGALSDWGYSITTDASGYIYVTGHFQGAVNFAADWGSTDSKTSAGNWDAFVTKIIY